LLLLDLFHQKLATLSHPFREAVRRGRQLIQDRYHGLLRRNVFARDCSRDQIVILLLQ
jgi:hypothetical protein